MADSTQATPQQPASGLPSWLSPENLTPNYVNPAYASPQQQEMLREYAKHLLSPQPVQHWAQGLDEMAGALMGGLAMRKAGLQQRASLNEAANQVDPNATPAPSPSAQPPPASAPVVPGAAPPPDDTSGSPSSNPANPLGLTAANIDQAVRTVYGEAGNQSPQGQQAVAAVIANRAKMGGQSLADVVHAQGQFEPWATRADSLNSLDPKSKVYQSILENISPVLMGHADPTQGATHFYSPGAQAAKGRPPPSWDNGTGVDFGGNRFFKLPYGNPRSVPGATVRAGAPSSDAFDPGAPGAPPPGLSQQDVTSADAARPGASPQATPAGSNVMLDRDDRVAGVQAMSWDQAVAQSRARNGQQPPPSNDVSFVPTPGGGPIAHTSPQSGSRPVMTDAQGRALDPATGLPTQTTSFAQSPPLVTVPTPGRTPPSPGGPAAVNPQSPPLQPQSPQQPQTTDQDPSTFAGLAGGMGMAPTPMTQNPGPALLKNPVVQHFASMSPRQMAQILVNPNTTQESKTMLMELVKPQIVKDAIGNQYVTTMADMAAGRPPTPYMKGFLPGSVKEGEVPTITTGTGVDDLTTRFLLPGNNAPVAPSMQPGNSPAAGPGAAPAPQATNAGPLPQSYVDLATQQARLKAQQKSFEDEAAKKSDLLTKYTEQGIAAQGKLAQIDALSQLGDKVDYGVLPWVQQKMGEYGWNTKNYTNIQAYQAAIDALAPQQRPEGSGNLLGQELAAFKGSLGGLMVTPEGRHIAAQNMKLLAQYSAQIGQIAGDMRLPGEERISRIQSLPAPHLVLPGSEPRPANAVSTSPTNAAPGSNAPTAQGGYEVDTALPDNLLEAQHAIAAGKNKAAVIQRLQQNGVDPAPLVESLTRRGLIGGQQ